MKAYLDTNIIVAIEDNEYTLEKLLNINREINEFPFSAAHIQETSNIIGLERIDLRLDTLEMLSRNSYLYEDFESRQIFNIKSTPHEVWETIIEFPVGKAAINLFTNLFSHELRNQVADDLGIKSSEINNYSPNQVLNQLNQKISVLQNISLLDMIEKAISFFPANSNFGLQNRMAAMMELIDMFGYWKDRQTNKSNTARFWDANHAYYATYCDYFITDDKRNRNKCKVLYEVYGIKTKVVSSVGI